MLLTRAKNSHIDWLTKKLAQLNQSESRSISNILKTSKNAAKESYCIHLDSIDEPCTSPEMVDEFLSSIPPPSDNYFTEWIGKPTRIDASTLATLIDTGNFAIAGIPGSFIIGWTSFGSVAIRTDGLPRELIEAAIASPLTLQHGVK